jgi:hypothetical protein
VGERHPELFIPKQAGTVVPNVSTHTSYGGVNQTININGATDFNSFKASRTQLEAAGMQAATAAGARNG